MGRPDRPRPGGRRPPAPKPWPPSCGRATASRRWRCAVTASGTWPASCRSTHAAGRTGAAAGRRQLPRDRRVRRRSAPRWPGGWSTRAPAGWCCSAARRSRRAPSGARSAPDSPAGRRVALVRELEAPGRAVHVAVVDVGDEAAAAPVPRRLPGARAGRRSAAWSTPPPSSSGTSSATSTRPRCGRQLRPKVVGAWLLERAPRRPRPLRAVLLDRRPPAPARAGCLRGRQRLPRRPRPLAGGAGRPRP